MMNYYTQEDKNLAEKMDFLPLLGDIDVNALSFSPDVQTTIVHLPDEEYGFLHEAAVIEYHGTLFASWYNCGKKELQGITPIRGRRSRDGGKTWSDIEVIAADDTGKILFCPPVYGVCDDTLYLLLNEMVSADHIHALDLYKFNEATDTFEFLWSRPIPFKLNTNVVALPNGKLMLPGRIAELDGFPNTPAVLISDNGKIDAEWRLVKIQQDGTLPDGSQLVHPELSAIVFEDTVYMFSRDDNRHVPLVYLSKDFGETWSKPMAHDIPFSNSKIYAGTLSDGRNYLIGNIYPSRRRLAVLFTRPHCLKFEDAFLLSDGYSEQFGFGGPQWSYPVAHEADGKLYVIFTVCTDANDQSIRGAVLSAIPL